MWSGEHYDPTLTSLSLGGHRLHALSTDVNAVKKYPRVKVLVAKPDANMPFAQAPL